MTAISVLAPGKVNLCLFLGGVRADGRHELLTLFESVTLADELRATAAERDQVFCPGIDGPNLVNSALERLRALSWDGPPLRIEIDKRIPVAAGMGGGSADAAAVLRVATELVPLDRAALTGLARALGADVPSQLFPGPSIGTGAGELIEPVPPLPEHALVIAPSPHQLSTAEVYREADRLGLGRPEPELARLAVELTAALRSGEPLPGRLLVNDLEPAAVSLLPPIADALDAVSDTGADRAIVCGSGPTVAGLFWGSEGEQRAGHAGSTLQSRFPGAISVAPVLADYGNPRIA